MELASVRIPLYVALWFCSFLVLCFTAARLQYTLHIPKGDTLNGGIDFYDPIVVELLVCSLLSLGTAPFVLRLVHRISSNQWLEIPRDTVEPIALAILSLLWIIGAGNSSSIWGNLSWCAQYAACRILSAMMAFAWLAWFSVVGLQMLYLIDYIKAKKAQVTAATTSKAAAASYPAMRERTMPPPPPPAAVQV